MRSAWIPAALILVLLIAFRALGAAITESLPNFSPLVAIFLCSVVCLRGAIAWLLPLGAWVLGNPIANLVQGYPAFAQPGPVFTALFTLVALGLAAVWMRRHPTAPVLLGSSLLAALLFHLVTSVAAWLTYPPYAAGAEGLWQAIWTGPPGAAIPSWAFLRNLAAANLLFTAVFLLAQHKLHARPATSPVLSQPGT